jgi:hypothetical protein
MGHENVNSTADICYFYCYVMNMLFRVERDGKKCGEVRGGDKGTKGINDRKKGCKG